jgi:F-type H+-transporting ATPase subunit c
MNRFVAFLFVMFFAVPAFAADGPANAGVAIAAAFAIAIAAFGGALGQGKAAAAALEGIARNPGAQNKIFTPMILALALIESLVIYALIIAFQLVGKV